MMKKIAVALLLILTCVLLFSCTSGDAPDSTSDATTVATDTSPAETTDTASDETLTADTDAPEVTTDASAETDEVATPEETPEEEPEESGLREVENGNEELGPGYTVPVPPDYTK